MDFYEFISTSLMKRVWKHILEINVHVRAEERGGVSSLGKIVFGEQELYNSYITCI